MKVACGSFAVEIIECPVAAGLATALSAPCTEKVKQEVVVKNYNSRKFGEEFDRTRMKRVIIADIVNHGVKWTPEIRRVADFVPSNYFSARQHVGAVKYVHSLGAHDRDRVIRIVQPADNHPAKASNG